MLYLTGNDLSFISYSGVLSISLFYYLFLFTRSASNVLEIPAPFQALSPKTKRKRQHYCNSDTVKKKTREYLTRTRFVCPK